MNDKLQNSLLITALRSLDKEGIKDFDLFVRSPYFNKNADLCRFWEVIKANLDKKSSKLTKIDLHRLLYKDLAFKDSRMRLLMSNLFLLFEEFVINNELKKKNLEHQNILVHFYRENGLGSHYAKKVKHIRKNFEKGKVKDSSFFGLNAALNFEEYQFQISKKRSSTNALKDTFHFTDLEYILLKLRYACILSSNKAAFKAEIEIEFLKEIIEFIKREELYDRPSIALYYNCYLLLESEEVKYFDRYKELLIKHIEVLAPIEIREVFLIGVNYCIRQMNLGNDEMSNKLFDLFELGLKGRHLLVEGSLSRFTYRNIVTIGLINKKFKWVENFIYEYKPNLDAKYRESMFTLNLALLKYEQKEYGEVQELLYQSEQKDLLLNLFAKTILLKVYYEQESIKLLDSHLDAMEIFIRRKKVIGYHRKHYMNIIKYTRKLLKLNPFDHDAKSKLLVEVQNADTIAEKKWLVKQLHSF